MRLHPLVQTRGLVSDQVSPVEVSIILEQLERQLAQNTDGAVVEFGCYVGTTSLFIRRLLDKFDYRGSFHVYDSFEGLPDKSAQDMSAAGDQFKAGELAATKKQFMHNFYKAGLKLPIIHKKWFDQLTPDDVPPDIMFAFLDGDYYESVRDSLRLVTPKLLPGATIIIDDYANEALPGARRAVDEWMVTQEATLRVEASLAIVAIAKH